MTRQIGRVLAALVVLSGCDSGARSELTELRAELARQAGTLAAQQEQIAALQAALERPRAGTGARPLGASDPSAEPAPMPTLTPSCADNHCILKRAEVDALFAAPAGLARLARVVPSVKDGVTLGIKLYAIRAGTPLALLGFKNGDLVRSLGGVELDSMDAMMRAYSEVRERDRWGITAVRKNVAFDISIEIR